MPETGGSPFDDTTSSSTHAEGDSGPETPEVETARTETARDEGARTVAARKKTVRKATGSTTTLRNTTTRSATARSAASTRTGASSGAAKETAGAEAPVANAAATQSPAGKRTQSPAGKRVQSPAGKRAQSPAGKRARPTAVAAKTATKAAVTKSVRRTAAAPHDTNGHTGDNDDTGGQGPTGSGVVTGTDRIGEPPATDPMIPAGHRPPEEVADDDRAVRPEDGHDGERLPTSGRKPPRAGRARRWFAANPAVVAMAVAMVVLAVALAAALSSLGSQHAVTAARTSALISARSYTVDIAGYDYRNLGHDFAVVEHESTPSFRRRYVESSDALKTLLVRYHGSASANVVSAGVISATASRAVVLVVFNQSVSNTDQSGATTDRSQLEMTLVRSGSRWLIDQVTLL